MEEEITRKDKQDDELTDSGWESIYCSLVLILVAFFAMLVSYSTVEGDRVTNFQRGFGSMATKAGAGKMYDAAWNSLLMEGGRDAVVSQGMASLQQYYKEAGLKSVYIEKTKNGFRATFGSNVLFSSGVAELSKKAYPYIDKMIEIARNNPFSIRVEGHSDNVPINTPEFPSNWELSTARAVNVLRCFLEKGNISADRLFAVGFSQYQPFASNESAEGRQKNRRVEFYFNLEENKRSS